MKKLTLLLALTVILFSCKPEAEKPTVVTKSVGEVTETTAKVVGQVTADGGAEVTERGFCWNTTGAPEVIDYRTVDGTGIGTFNSNISDLVPNTQYYVRAYATNEMGTSYGDEKSFTTLEVIPEDPENPEQPVGPVVITVEVTDITVNSAKCGGGISDGGGAAVIERGVCWNTSGNPTVLDFTTKDGSGLGTYISNITGLEHNTTYYVRAYAVNANGVAGYGPEVSFTTLEKLLPTVTTATEVTNITVRSATCGGEVTFDGNVSVTARGICWSTSQNPTIEDNKTTDGTGVGIFTSILSNLEHNTTYYVRAYATNEVGTAYGEERTFKTLAAYSPATGTSNGYGYVDLGLSVKWATCNVGANSPEAYGDYFAWGETSPKAEYTKENSLTYGKDMSDISGNPQYDAATANWGGTWRMPTYDELNELRTNCIWTWITQNGVKGYNVEGPNGNSIFLPAAGDRYGSSLYDAGSDFYYWSSTPVDVSYDHVTNAYDLHSFCGYQFMGDYDLYYGRSVRPVIE